MISLEKQEKLLAKDIAVINKDARRTSRVMDAEQRNVIRRSTSVHVSEEISHDLPFINNLYCLVLKPTYIEFYNFKILHIILTIEAVDGLGIKGI